MKDFNPTVAWQQEWDNNNLDDNELTRHLN